MSTLSRHPAGGKTPRVIQSGAIQLGPNFALTQSGLVVTGRPSFQQWAGIGDVLHFLDAGVPYAIGDWLAYGESREEWGEKIHQAMGVTGLSEKTLRNYVAIARSVEEPERLLAQTVAHASEVAALPRPDQTKWLDKSRTEGWTRHELRKHIRSAKRMRVIEGQATLEGMFRVFLADPGWRYDSAGGASDGAFRTAEETYPTMSIEDLCRLPVAAHALPDSVLFLWVTAPMLLENPGPREVIEAWGFKPKSGMVWDKVLGNFGNYVRVHHEHLIIATRGSCTPDAPTPQPDSVQTVRRSDEHSEKPEEFRQIIDRLYTHGRKVELFARKQTPGWIALGNDCRLWDKEMRA